MPALTTCQPSGCVTSTSYSTRPGPTCGYQNAVAGEVDALLRDDPGRLAEAARVLLLLVGEAEVELPLVLEPHRAAGRGRGHAVALERDR